MVSIKGLRYCISIFGFFILGLYPISESFAAPPGRTKGWQMGPGMMGDWGMGWFGGIFMFVFWILVIVGLIFMVKWLMQAEKKGKEDGEIESRAIEILKKRYASGEIDKSQFETMKQDLRY